VILHIILQQVIFDTLIEQSKPEEVEAVIGEIRVRLSTINGRKLNSFIATIAHELGHWKHGMNSVDLSGLVYEKNPLTSYWRLFPAHPSKLMVVGQINLLITLSAFTLFIHNPAIFRSFGFSEDVAVRQQPVIIGFFLYQLIMNPLDPLISLLMNSVTRRYEYEAGESFLAF